MKEEKRRAGFPTRRAVTLEATVPLDADRNRDCQCDDSRNGQCDDEHTQRP